MLPRPAIVFGVVLPIFLAAPLFAAPEAAPSAAASTAAVSVSISSASAVAVSTASIHVSTPAIHVAVSSASAVVSTHAIAAVAVSTPSVRVATMSFAAVAPSTPPVSVLVVWPEENQKYPFLRRSFIFGNATPGSSVTVNGQPLPLRKSGAFFAMVNFSTGAFALSFAAQKGEHSTATVRTVLVAGLESSEGLKEAKSLDPAADMELRAGDFLLARCRGPAGLSGSFSIKHLAKNLPLVEKSPGLYEGHYLVGPRDKGKDLKVDFILRGTGWKKFKAEAAGRITVADPRMYRVALSSAPLTVVKSGAMGYSFFVSSGIFFTVTGRAGPMLRVALSDEEEGWVEADRMRLLPEGTPPLFGQIGKNFTTSVSSEAVKLQIQVDRRLPFEIRTTAEPLGFEIRFFGAMHRMDRIHYASDDPVIREITWRQEKSHVVEVGVQTRLKLSWGYDAFYENGRFVLEIRRPPRFVKGKGVLAGRTIVVDPGHAPDRGALGPMGSQEQNLNLAIALELKKLLEAEKANVYMIRSSTAGVPLADRPGLAWAARGDILVSVHNNALAVTDDPFDAPHGYMIFYYQPQSRRLAEAVHARYRRNFSDLTDEGLHWGDLHVCRTPQMPAILTESAYVIFPEQEAMLMDPRIQKKFARTILEGIRDFYKAYQDIQQGSAQEKAAARL